MVYITTAATYNIGKQSAIFIQVNAALTGTITVAALGDTQYGTAAQTIAVITNPTVGSSFRYGGLHTYGQITIVNNATTDSTVTPLARIV